MNDTPQIARALFLEGHNCAQAVLIACGRGFGLPAETAIKVAQAFGGGLGRTGNVCGAVSGALMAIGLARSIRDPKDAQSKQEANRLAQEFLSRFRVRHGSLLCRELLGCDLSTEDGRKKAHEEGLTKKACPPFVQGAAEIFAEVARQF